MNWNNPTKWHYAASVFPLMPPDELEALAADIKSNGLLNPIIRCSGKILDGRNRALACFAAGIEPRFRDIIEKQAETWARSQNIFRRTLRPNQQAIALVALSQAPETSVVGRKGLRAYHKLKLLKEAASPLFERLKHGEDVFAELEQLFKPKKNQGPEKNIFVLLHDKLHLLEPSWSDGDEHIFVKQIEQAICIPVGDQVQEHCREALALTLERLSRDFLKYSNKLRIQT